MIIMVFEKLLKIGFLTIKRKWMMEWVLKKWKLNRNEFQRDFSVFNSDQVQKMIPIKLNSLEPQMNDLNYRFSWKEFDLNQKWTTSSLRWMIWITGLVIKILFELKGEKFKKNSKKNFSKGDSLKLERPFNAYEKNRFDVMYECKNGWAFYNTNVFNVNAKITFDAQK